MIVLFLYFTENQVDMIEFLFENGCDIIAQDKSGQTAAHYGQEAVYYFLLSVYF